VTPRNGLLVGVSVVWVPLAFLFDGVTVLLLPVRFAGSSNDATLVGLVSAVGLLAGIAVQPLAGRVGDLLRARLERRDFLALAAVPALGGLWLLAGATAVPLAIVGYIVCQAGTGVMQASQQALVPEHVRMDAHGRASGVRSLFDVGGAFLAFAVLGAVLATRGLATAAAVITSLLVVALVLARLLVPASTTAREPSRAPAARLTTRLPSPLLQLMAARFLFLLGTYAVGRFLVLLVAERLGVGTASAVADAGALLAVLTLATAAAAIPAGWATDRLGGHRLMAAGAVVSAVGILALAPPLGVVGLLVGGLAMSVGTAAFVVPNWAAITALTPADDAGRLLGWASIATGGAAACAGALGTVIDRAGFAPALVIAAAASAAAVIPVSLVAKGGQLRSAT
jgi:MFS family permease